MAPAFNKQDYASATNAVRAGTFFDEIGAQSEPLYLSSSFRFNNAAQAAARFQGEEPGYVYSRFGNPTVHIFEERIAALESGQWCVASATGMSAILTTCLALLKQGDHIVSSLSQFGSTTLLFTNILAKFGISSTFVSLSDINAWENAISDIHRRAFLWDVRHFFAVHRQAEHDGELMRRPVSRIKHVVSHRRNTDQLRA